MSSHRTKLSSGTLSHVFAHILFFVNRIVDRIVDRLHLSSRLMRSTHIDRLRLRYSSSSGSRSCSRVMVSSMNTLLWGYWGGPVGLAIRVNGRVPPLSSYRISVPLWSPCPADWNRYSLISSSRIFLWKKKELDQTKIPMTIGFRANWFTFYYELCYTSRLWSHYLDNNISSFFFLNYDWTRRRS